MNILREEEEEEEEDVNINVNVKFKVENSSKVNFERLKQQQKEHRWKEEKYSVVPGILQGMRFKQSFYVGYIYIYSIYLFIYHSRFYLPFR